MRALEWLGEQMTLGAIGWHAVRLYRLSHRLWTGGHPTTALIIAAANRVLTGVEIHPGARFGPRLTIVHGSGLVVNGETRAGSDCVLHQGVTLGTRAADGKPPTLGDRVQVFPGARVLGDISIGDDARIGPNAVVITSLRAGATVVAPRTIEL